MPLARPAGCRNVESSPSALHFRMRSLGWSVKKMLPCASIVDPSVKPKPPASFSNLAPGATTLGPVSLVLACIVTLRASFAPRALFTKPYSSEPASCPLDHLRPATWCARHYCGRDRSMECAQRSGPDGGVHTRLLGA